MTNLGAFGVIALLDTADQRSTTSCATTPGLWTIASGAGGADDDLPAVARRLPADRRASSRKWYIFTAAMQAGYYWLAIIGVLTSVVSVFFYLRIVVMMYMTEEAQPRRAPLSPSPAMAALGFAMLATFYLGVLPARVINYALQSIQTIF